MRKQGRKCQGCGEIIEHEALFKITRNLAGEVKLDPPSSFTGRSCYICKNQDCIKATIKKKRISKALKIPYSENIAKLEEKLNP